MGEANGRLVVDNSILSATAKCSTYAYVRYACGLNTKDESLALRAGSAIHVGFAVWLSGGKPAEAIRAMSEDYEHAVELYLRKVERERLSADDRRFQPEWVEAVFSQYLTRYATRWPFKVIIADATEKPISAPFEITIPSGKEVTYVARLDAIVRKWESGGKWLMDHKSTKKVSEWWEAKQKTSSQFSGQMWLARTIPLQAEGVVLNVIEVPEPHRSVNKCRDHGVSYQECSIRHAGSTFIYVTRSEAELEAWVFSAKKLIRKYDRLLARAEEMGVAGVVGVPMEGRFNEGCTFCSMKEWCRLGRNVRKPAVRATFVSDVWDPLKETDA